MPTHAINSKIFEFPPCAGSICLVLCYRFHVHVTVRSTVAAFVGGRLSGVRVRPANYGILSMSSHLFGYVQTFKFFILVMLSVSQSS